MKNTVQGESKYSGWAVVLAGWAISIVLGSLVVAIRATHREAMDPFMPFVMLPIWMCFILLISFGTFEVTKSIEHKNIRIFLTILAVGVQCVLLFMLGVFAVYIHLWAGGNL